MGEQAERVSWVELYLDLVFVLAVGQIARLPAAGVDLLLEDDPPRIAYWLACVGPGMYLAGTRAFMLATSRLGGLVRLALLVATFQLARVRPELSPHAYLWLLAAWVVMCAALTTRRDEGEDQGVLERFVGGPARASR